MREEISIAEVNEMGKPYGLGIARGSDGLVWISQSEDNKILLELSAINLPISEASEWSRGVWEIQIRYMSKELESFL